MQGTKYKQMKNKISLWMAQPSTGMMLMVVNALLLGFEIAMMFERGLNPVRAVLMPLLAFSVGLQWRNMRVYLPQVSRLS
jgi:uncharacterized membrane protein YbjE (DUF340 family)